MINKDSEMKQRENISQGFCKINMLAKGACSNAEPHTLSCRRENFVARTFREGDTGGREKKSANHHYAKYFIIKI